MKSMNRHMGKVTFEEDPEKPGKGAAASGKGSGSGAGPGGKASPAKG
jgi:hypothetical protein